jgi:TorA maturation chaperone TorD
MREVKDLLATGAGWKFLSSVFKCPGDVSAPSIEKLASELPSELGDSARAICSMLADPQVEAVYHRLLGSGGPVSPYGSDYQGSGEEGVREKGVILGDVAGFYKAFEFDHSSEVLEVPDHIAVELAFISYLKLKEAYALMNDDESAYRICREAEDEFLNEHLLGWVPQFVERITGHGAHEYYDMAARLLGQFIEIAEKEMLPTAKST